MNITMTRTTRRLAAPLMITLTLALAAGCDSDPCEGLESGHACTWLGLKGEEGFNGDGLHRSETIVSQPQDLLFMPDGTAWFTDFNNFLIRRVHPDGTVETMVGSVDPIFPGDGPLGGPPPGGADGLDWLRTASGS